MKNEKAENSKINKSEPRRVAGVPVRSGVKAGGVSRKGPGGITNPDRGSFTGTY